MNISSYLLFMEKIFRALANRNRLRIVKILGRGPLNVSEISTVLRLSQSNISHSLRTLLDAGIVVRRGKGSWVYYSLNRSDESPCILLDAVEELEAHSDEQNHDMDGLARCYRDRRSFTEKFFDDAAGRENEMPRLAGDPSGYLQIILDMLPDEGHMLEIGCGRGDILRVLCETGRTVTGVDHSAEMLNTTRKILAKSGLNDCADLRLGTAEHLPVANNSIDCILAHMILHHLGEPSVLFEEVARVLKDKGSMIVAELAPHDDMEMRDKLGDLWPGLDENDVISWAKQAGFEVKKNRTAEDGKIYIFFAVKQ